MALGEVARDSGRGAECIRHCHTVVEHAAASGQEAARIWAHVGVAQGHLLRGHRAEAAAALERAEREGSSPLATSRSTLERTAAWLVACGGDLPGARQRLLSIASDVRADGVVLFEGRCSTTSPASGRRARSSNAWTSWRANSTDRSSRCSRCMPAPSPTAMPPRSTSCVDGFEHLDSLALAAESAAELAEVLRRAGEQRAASAASQRSAALAARAGGVATPPMARGEGPEPLTAREREIAMLAASGVASREIGDRLFVWTRTVDTHLARVYRKLGVTSRAELARAMDPSGPTPPALSPPA